MYLLNHFLQLLISSRPAESAAREQILSDTLPDYLVASGILTYSIFLFYGAAEQIQLKLVELISSSYYIKELEAY